jgi:putative ABC transport system substrate-binding protein
MIAGKRLEILREVVPSLHRLAILANVDYPFAVLEMAEVQAAGGTLHLDVVNFEIRRAEDIAPAFEALKGRADALYVVNDASRLLTGYALTPWPSPPDCRRCTALAR